MTTITARGTLAKRAILLTAASALAFAAGACEDRSAAAVAVERAEIRLANVTDGDSGATALRGVVTELTPFTREGTASEKAAASLLVARAQIGLGGPLVDQVISAEGEALNLLNVARAELMQWSNLSAAADAYGSFDPTEDLAAMRADLADRQRELDAAQASQNEYTQRVDGLMSQIEDKLGEARTKRVEEGELTLRLAQVSATEAAELAEQARRVGREADAIEFEAAEIEAQAAETRPQLLEAQLDVNRLRAQIATIESAMQEVQDAADQSAADARTAQAAADEAADRFDFVVAEIVRVRSEQIDGPTEEARTVLSSAARSASSARSAMRDQATVVLGHANQWLATLLSARVAGLEALSTKLDRAVNSEPAAPDAARYATMLSGINEQLEEERAALDEALGEAHSVLESGNLREPAPYEEEYEEPEGSGDGYEGEDADSGFAEDSEADADVESGEG